MHIRIIPVVIFAAMLMLGVKIGSLWGGLTGGPVSNEAVAQEAAARATKGAAAPPATGGKDAARAADPKTAAAGSPAGTSTHPSPGTRPMGPSGLPDDPTLFTQSEIDLLQKLADRRAELDKWAQDLGMREQLLKAAETRIEKKVEELKAIQGKIRGMLKQYDKEQEEKLKSLVKIYEKMKPKDAARIFMELEGPILLDVIERMREAKAAAIIADLDPVKARHITDDLAARRKFKDETRGLLPKARAAKGSRGRNRGGAAARRGPLPATQGAAKR